MCLEKTVSYLLKEAEIQYTHTQLIKFTEYLNDFLIIKKLQDHKI